MSSMKRSDNELKEALVAQALDSPEGRVALAQAIITQPFHINEIEKLAICRKVLSTNTHTNQVIKELYMDNPQETNGKNLIPSQTPRKVAQWEAALKELINANLIVERGHKGEVFEVSSLGYQIADMIELQP